MNLLFFIPLFNALLWKITLADRIVIFINNLATGTNVDLNLNDNTSGYCIMMDHDNYLYYLLTQSAAGLLTTKPINKCVSVLRRIMIDH
jgi:hypothetical protein